MLREKGAEHIRVFGGGGDTITLAEIESRDPGAGERSSPTAS